MVGNLNNGLRYGRSNLLIPAGVVVLAILTYVSMNWLVVGVGIVVAAIYAVLLAKVGAWPTMVGTSILVSVLRSGPPAELLGESAWYALQFGPILVAWLSLLSQRPVKARRNDRNVVLFLVLFAVAALATNLTSLVPASTLPQTVMLAGMTGFLIFTYRRRWTSKETILGDVRMVFILITALQFVAVASVPVGQQWAFDPDYGRFRGLFSNANYAGMMSAIGLAVGLYLLRVQRRRAAVLASMAVLLAGMLMSGSRGSLLAIGAALLVLVLSRAGRKVIIPMGVLAGIAAVFALLVNPWVFDGVDRFFIRDSASTDVTSGRLEIYEGMLRLFSQSPFTGTGYRSVEALSPDASGLAGHNIYLTILTETGLFGALFFVGLVFVVLDASKAGKISRPLLVVVVTIATVELTESSIYGWGGPTALSAWLLILGFAASGRFLSEEEPAVESPAAASPVRTVVPRLAARRAWPVPLTTNDDTEVHSVISQRPAARYPKALVGTASGKARTAVPSECART